MSHLIAGIDESVRPNRYLLCATVVSTADRADVRQALRAMLLPNQRRLHAKRESEGRRRMLLKVLSNTAGFSCLLVVGQGCDERDRGSCLRALVVRLRELEVREVILERIDPGTIARDRAIMDAVGAGADDFDWRHEDPSFEPLLWISDLVANAYGAGGDLRKATASMVSQVLTADRVS